MIFSFLSYLALPFAIFYLLIKGRWKEVGKRLGLGIKKNKKKILFHCASVGEITAATPLLEKLENIFVTTMSLTGLERAKKYDCALLPFDIPFIMVNFLKKIEPSLIILMETEIWPNLVLTAKRAKIPIIIVNGRLTEKSFNPFKRYHIFFKPIIEYIDFVGTQSEKDKARFKELGFKQVENLGNLKFTVNYPKYNAAYERKKIGISDDDFVIVFGCLREGEEIILANIYKKLKDKIKNLKLIIVPRHLNWIKKLQKSFAKSKLLSKDKNSEIIIVDKMGELSKMYAISNLSIVGGSFVNYKGHNPIEAVFYEKPTIIGNYHSSCYEVVKKLKNGILVSNKKKLLSDILNLYKDRDLQKNMVEISQKVLSENRNSKYKKLIDSYL